jgi:MFS family permease
VPILADVGPLRRHRSFRRLWVGQLVSGFGSQLTIVAVAYQAYELTHSTLIVGLVSLAQLGPLLVGSLVGGSLVDAKDRRKVLLVTQVVLGSTSLGLAVNAGLAHPALWPLFVLTAAGAAVSGVDWPGRKAALPMLVSVEDLPAALAIQQVGYQGAAVAGPALAGLLIARLGLSWVYSIDVASFGAALIAVAVLPSLVPTGGGRPAGLASIREGLRYLRHERLLASTFWIDLDAMVFGLPRALFPALGTGLYGGGAAVVGLLYAAPAAGAFVGALLTGWVSSVRRQGRAVVIAVLAWGTAVALFGLVPVLWFGLVMLGVAGAADVISAVFRNAILQTTVPEQLQGRLSGTFIAVVTGGPRLGDAEAGAAAALAGPQVAAWSGGVACVVGAVALAWRAPQLWRYDTADGLPASSAEAIKTAVGELTETGSA